MSNLPGGGDFGRAHPEVLPVPELRAQDPTNHWGRGLSVRAARDQSAEHSPGLSGRGREGGGGRREMKRSKVLRVRTRELERIRRQLGKGGGEGREQQRSAERNVLMGRQPERQPGPPPSPPPPSQGCLKAPDLSKPFNWSFKKLPCSLTRRGLRFMPKMTQFPLSPPCKKILL